MNPYIPEIGKPVSRVDSRGKEKKWNSIVF